MTQRNKNSVETRLIHGDRKLNSTSAVVAPIYQTATFRGVSGEDFAKRAGEARHPEFYTRYGNPTLSQVESVLAALEGTESALVTASGMAAVSATVLTILGKGDHVVAQTNHYGGTTNLLQRLIPRFGIEVTQVDQRDSSAFERAVRPNTKLIVVESPSNPIMTLTDLRAVAAIAKSRGITTLIDNTFATPLNQRPIDLGMDLVFHSATKYFGGHSDLIAGAVMGSKEWITNIWNTHVILGAALGPFDAWLMLRGLRTLALRVRQHNENALQLAQALEKHPSVESVYYPGLKSHPQHELANRQMSGFGGMLSFEIKGGYEAADRFLSRLQLASRAASLGGVETLAVHPASNFLHYMTLEEAAKIGIAPGLLRISVGLEGKDDLVSDFEQALCQSA
ncbi:MAG: methionine gamma-lyase [Acidobacteria bacterium]|nr:MAG: methionine gamma-lyase [Acidobacteriota bacterium]